MYNHKKMAFIPVGSIVEINDNFSIYNKQLAKILSFKPLKKNDKYRVQLLEKYDRFGRELPKELNITSNKIKVSRQSPFTQKIQYTLPQQTQYTLPQQPQFTLPQQPQFTLPQQPQFTLPQQHQYTLPQEPQFTLPQEPQFTLPQEPQFTLPQEPQYLNQNYIKPNNKTLKKLKLKSKINKKMERKTINERIRNALNKGKKSFPKGIKIGKRGYSKIQTPKGSKYTAKISVRGQCLHIGTFKTEEEARKAYLSAANSAKNFEGMKNKNFLDFSCQNNNDVNKTDKIN